MNKALHHENGHRSTYHRMMIVAADEHLRHVAAAACREPVFAESSPEAFDCVSHLLLRVIIFVARTLDPHSLVSLQMLHDRAHYLPLILVTSSDPNNSRQLKDVDVDDVIWLENVDVDLHECTMRILEQSSIAERFALLVADRLSTHDASLRAAIMSLGRDSVNVPSVPEFARVANTSATRLRAKVATALGSPPMRSISTLLDCLLVLKAFDLTCRHAKISSVAHVLKVDERTLTRASIRITSRTFARLRKLPPGEVLELVRRRCGIAQEVSLPGSCVFGHPYDQRHRVTGAPTSAWQKQSDG